MSSAFHVESDNQLCFTIGSEQFTTMYYLRKGYLFQRHLCKNTDELMQEENIEKFSVLEVYLGPCQLSIVEFFAKMVKDFWSYTISEKNISIASDI